jgi:hypothetical protein
MVDETDGWIFSDDGHRWMDRRRAGMQANYQRCGRGERPGWEHGLFGFKPAEGHPKRHNTAVEDYDVRSYGEPPVCLL